MRWQTGYIQETHRTIRSLLTLKRTESGLERTDARLHLAKAASRVSGDQSIYKRIIMRKTIGPVVVMDTNPPVEPYRRWDGNQATYLFFPLFVSFLLVLLSGLSEPIIGGLSVVNVDSGVNGTLSLGTWGWCVKGVPGVE